MRLLGVDRKTSLERLRSFAFGASFLLLALLFCGRAIFHAGWPHNHEYLAAFERVECFRRSFAAGDWLPTWTPYPYAGFGSPFPLLYHRLFNSIGGLVAVLLGSSVLAVKVLIPALLLCGGLGSYRLSRELGVSRSLSWISGVLLMAAPYTLFDWLVRGAVAEFTAAMLLPWWLGALLGFLRGQRRWLRLALLTALLFHAHSLICLFALPLALAVFLFAFLSRALSLSVLVNDWRQIAAGGLLLCVCLAPFALAMGRVAPFLNTQEFTNLTSPAREMRPFTQYFVDDEFSWGEQWAAITVEINRFLVVTTLAVAFAAACLQVRLRRASTRIVTAAFAVYLFLQVPASNWMYAHVPGAAYIQFPWRLNTFMTPLLILLLAIAGQACAVRSKRAWRCVHLASYACLLLSLQFPVRAMRLDYGKFTAQELETNLAFPTDDVTGDEYLPKGVKSPLPPLKLGKRRHDGRREPHQLVENQPPATALVTSDCAQTWPADIADKALVLVGKQATECQLTIRQFISPVLSLELENATLQEGPIGSGYRILLHAGQSRVALQPKSVLRLAIEYFSKHS